MEKQEYIEKNEKLFDRWKKTAFVTDGIIDLDEWFKLDNDKHILVVLKEAYIRDGNFYDWDLTKWIQGEQCCENRECGKSDCSDCKITGSTYNRVAEWIYGITTGKYDTWLGLKNEEQTISKYCEERKKQLKKVAIINVKKRNGTKVSSKSELKCIAKIERDNLKQQIDMISPSIIICGGTIECLKIVYGKDYSDSEKNVLIIDSPHPNARVEAQEMFNNILQQMINRRN